MRDRPGFSLLELVVVLAVSVVLAGLLLPVLTHVRENVNRVMSASNMRQIGLGISMYDRDFDDLPYSYELQVNDAPDELTVLHLDEPSEWDGLGLLYAGDYCGMADVFYCPSNVGEHRLDRYQYDFEFPDGKRIYGNYHYAGHKDWETPRRRRLSDGANMVLVTDGLRTIPDLNHENGMNILRGDGSVRWRELSEVSSLLPMDYATAHAAEDFRKVWRLIEEEL